LIALALVIITSSSLAEAAPINNESVDNVPIAVQEEVQTDRPQIETPVVIEPVVEPVPAPVAAKVPQPTVHPIGCENYRQEVSKYDWNVEVMMKIMRAESSCNPAVVGDNYPIRGLLAPSCGLFQIRTLSSRPSCDELKDPATNIAWAYRIYQSQGYPAWSVCRTKVSCY